jgi:hypothetical protein
MMIGLGLSVVVASAADAQRPIPGFPRSDQTDVTGPAVTSGDQLAALFTEPGTIRSMFCPVAWGVRTAADRVQTRLTSATLQPALIVGGAEIGSTAQLVVLNLMLAEGRDRRATEPVLAALTAGNARSAQRPARRLVDEVRGLFHVVEDMDPLRPGERAPTRLSRVVGAYNALVDASSPEFLHDPPAEFTAIHAVLNYLVIGSLENEGRPEQRSIVDEAGLACAILFPAVPVAEVPPPPVEQAIEICLWVDGDFRNVAAVRRPALGDTMVIVAGDRQLLSEVYPAATDVPSPPWVPSGEPVTVGTVEYQPFGVSRIVGPGEMSRRGQVEGYDYYALAAEPSAPVIYFLAGPNCEVQPYRSVETIRVRG